MIQYIRILRRSKIKLKYNKSIADFCTTEYLNNSTDIITIYFQCFLYLHNIDDFIFHYFL